MKLLGTKHVQLLVSGVTESIGGIKVQPKHTRRPKTCTR